VSGTGEGFGNRRAIAEMKIEPDILRHVVVQLRRIWPRRRDRLDHRR